MPLMLVFHLPNSPLPTTTTTPISIRGGSEVATTSGICDCVLYAVVYVYGVQVVLLVMWWSAIKRRSYQ